MKKKKHVNFKTITESEMNSKCKSNVVAYVYNIELVWHRNIDIDPPLNERPIYLNRLL